MFDRVAVAEDAYMTCIDIIAEVQPQGVALERNGALHVKSGARIGMMNPSLVHDATRIDAAVDDAFAFHKDNATPVWNLVTRAIDAGRVGPVAEARGFTNPVDLPFMILDKIPDAPAHDDLSITRVTDLAGVVEHLHTCATGFGMNYDDIEAIATQGFLDPRFIVFVGHVEGRPVTASCAAFSDGAGVPCVGVWNVCTAPDYRGRGLGHAMTAHAAAAGRDAWGAGVAFLQSSAMGYPVYLKMGYDEVARWHRWTPPA